MKPKVLRMKFTPKQRKMIHDFVNSVLAGIALGIGVVFVSFITRGIFDGWKSILWWAYSVGFALAFMGLSYFKLGKKAFRWSKIIVLVGFLVLFPLFSANTILHYQGVAQSLSTPKQTEYFKTLLNRNYNYTELIQWENANIHWNDSASMESYSEPIQIYEYGQARCAGYAILYAELCISQGYEARVVVNIFGDHVWTEIKLNNTWTRVDSSPTGAPMSDNIGYPLFYEERWHTPPILALAFEGSSIVDVTSNYRSDRWSLLSLTTVVFLFIGAWFAICIGIIWKFLFRPLRESFSIQRKLMNPNRYTLIYSNAHSPLLTLTHTHTQHARMRTYLR
jgi:hypothetical protein